MTNLEDIEINYIRTPPWFKNEGNLLIDQEIIEEAVKNLKLKHCPVCRTELENKDNFLNPFSLSVGHGSQKRFGYCPKDNYIIELSSHQYEGHSRGTHLHMKIYTNSMFFQTLADSGVLADIKGKHVDLPLF